MSSLPITCRWLPAILFLAGCNEAPRQVTPQQTNKYIDSAVAAELVEKRTEAEVQLERRMTIEVRPKADSIVEALSKPQPVQDSLQRLKERNSPLRPKTTGTSPFTQPD